MENRNVGHGCVYGITRTVSQASLEHIKMKDDDDDIIAIAVPRVSAASTTIAALDSQQRKKQTMM